MIAVVFTALPTKAEVYYTGTVQTMDSDGILKNVFFEGDPVYVNVTLWYQDSLVDSDIRLRLLWDGGTEATMIAQTDTPVAGYFNSTIVPATWLPTDSIWFDGDSTVADIELSVRDPYDDWQPIFVTQITLRNEGVSLDPETFPYYPGQDITITVMTSNTEEFYVQVWNDENHDLVPEWTHEEVDEDGVWSENFTIPDDADSGTYRVRVLGELSDTLWFQTQFVIATFGLTINADRTCVLPGETVTVEYLVFDIATLDLYTEVETEWNAIWWNETGVEQLEVGELVPSYLGSEMFTIPADINQSFSYDLHFWVNDTEDRSADESFSIGIGQLWGDVYTDEAGYLAGEKVTVGVDAWVEYDWYDYDYNDLPDADVDIEVEMNGEVMELYGATDLVTGASGEAEHEFTLSDEAQAGTYTVTATISKVGYSVVRMTTFEVGLSYWFMVELDKDDYYSGETATAEFTAVWGSEMLMNMSVFYIVESEVGSQIYGNTTVGEASFEIPVDFVGQMNIEAMTMVNGNFLWATDDANVEKAFIAISVDEYEYSAGDTVQWRYQIMTAMTEGLLSYSIGDSMGLTVASTTIPFATSGTIAYTVPAENPADWYNLEIVLKDGLGNSVSASLLVELVSDYTITVWLAGDSGFVGGAFETGDTVELAYEITTNGAPQLSVYQIWYIADWSDGDPWMSVLTTSPTGTLTMTVPEGAADGTYWVDVELYDGVNLIGGLLSEDFVQVDVEADQSGWSKEIAGMSAIDFVMLVLIVVMIVLLIVVPFLKGRSGPLFKKKEPEPMTMAPPPAEQPPAPPQ